MRVQLGIVASALVGAMMAVPFFYEHRMNDVMFIGGLLAFLGAPFLAGLFQKRTHRPTTLFVAILLLLCPVVYVVTDGLATDFEKLRDGFFLGVGSTVVFVATSWLIESFKVGRQVWAVVSGFCLLSAALAIYALLWMVIYFE